MDEFKSSISPVKVCVDFSSLRPNIAGERGTKSDQSLHLEVLCFLTDPIVFGDEECEVHVQGLPRAVPATLLPDVGAEKVQGDAQGDGVQESNSLHLHKAGQGRDSTL